MDDVYTAADAYVAAVNDAATLDALDTLRVDILGKSGSLTQRLKTLGSLPPEQRKEAGQAVNAAKMQVQEAIDARKAVLEEQALQQRLQRETLDLTLPPLPVGMGSLHPIPQTIERITAIFTAQGFSVAQGPDVEDDFHNFTALNIPPHHPARAMHDTFYMQNGNVLRTHTSPVQIRSMMRQKPPMRLLAPGRTYRCDSDQTHTPMFHQIEGLVVEDGIHMGHLKGCLQHFLQTFFDIGEYAIRFRPSFFPFTEPSAEVDIRCQRRNGKLELGTGDDWLEVLGCGMVHPNVFKACGMPDSSQGFAFGMGVERMAMLKEGIADLRTFFASDGRWLRHYGQHPFAA